MNGTQSHLPWRTASENETLYVDSVSIITVRSSIFDEDSGLSSCNLTLRALQYPTEAVLVYAGCVVEDVIVDLRKFSVINGIKYTLSLRAVDKAGQQTLVYSYFHVDDSPPIPGRVLDGSGEIELRCHGSVHMISAGWTPFVDSESTLTYYQIAVTTSPQLDEPDLAKFGLTYSAPSADVELQHDRANSLRDGAVLYIIVRATNAAGLSSSADSGPLAVRCSTFLCQCPNYIVAL